MLKNKWLIFGIIATVLIIVGGILLLSKGGNSAPAQNRISDTILMPGDAKRTGGIVNGVYQPANSSAKVTLVEFGDYQCPACGSYNPLIIKILTDFAGKINFVFRDFAFIGPESTKAAEATYCASDQNKYWEFHEYLYTHQNGENKGNFSDDNLKSIAKTLGLDTQSFNACLDSGKYQSKVDSGNADARLAKIDSTPSFFINGVKIDTPPASYEDLKKLISDALSNAPAPSGSPTNAYHIHFNMKVYINGVLQNYTADKFQESSKNPLAPNMHFHDGVDTLVHVHKENVPLSEFFDSINVTFLPDSSTNNLKVYVNGQLNSQGLKYVPQDLDQILVSYGQISDKNIAAQIASVTNNACVYSLKCPERGTPPPEECVGGLGTGCTD